jgi:hypothetical protein
MSYEIQVLRALLRLARRREAGTEEALLDRVGGTATTLRLALRRLEKQDLIDRTSATSARLTMTGFAVAVATANVKMPARPAAAPKATPKPATRPRRRVRAA